MKILITGGAGFIGSALVRRMYKEGQHELAVIDKLTYAGQVARISDFIKSYPDNFFKADIADGEIIENIIVQFEPDIIFHFAAESHVDNSIARPEDFIKTNIVGTFNLLEASRKYLKRNLKENKSFKFIHVSTDEVYGELPHPDLIDSAEDVKFSENSRYQPSSPYSASKASSDFLVSSYFRTYKFPGIITNCSNNFGPQQDKEKLIPKIIKSAVELQSLPIYGNGRQIRDWLFVEDHISALIAIMMQGDPGQKFCIGGDNELMNLVLVQKICAILDEIKPIPNGNKVKRYNELISFVEDRKGHDLRYGIDSRKIREELGWRPSNNFEQSLRETIAWYLESKPT